jgi:hypothetical protein
MVEGKNLEQRGVGNGAGFSRRGLVYDPAVKRRLKWIGICAGGLVLLVLCGCGKETALEQKGKTPAKHEHKPPHGGTPVVLGHEEYHVELVLEAATGTMQAYVMNGELEEFVRVSAPSFEVAAQRAGGEETLVFKAVPNRATGETVGDTSFFTAQAEWLKTAKTFDAVLKELKVQGSVYQNVAFNFPKGNDTDGK